MRGRKLSSLFCLPQPQAELLLIFAPNPRNKIKKPSHTRLSHSVHCILYDIALKPRSGLFDPHNTVFPLYSESSGSWSNLFSDWCDSNPASNCRQRKRISTKYCDSTKRIRRKLYNKKSASVVRLPSRVSPWRPAVSSFLPHPLRQDLRKSTIFAQHLSIFENLGLS
ncbi:uncharacterized protein TrAFT101_011576 [Trichoderma asperellum]|uniref:uncharacterized protein n=1 Tax=Trichoderma asperellum TaxID=101201 RepID=UPI00332EAE7D|nr:hypothetical protein TrAFT101_011576 [Trichoderma asperellum]